MSSPSLDDPESYRSFDPAGMLGVVLSFPEMLDTARRIALAANLTPHVGQGAFRNVVVSGLGGSAIGGDLARALVAGSLPVPMYVNRDYGIPAFVDEETLFIASSYSGSTEETLSATAAAQERGAAIVAITSGGKLREVASEDGHPAIIVPGGCQPRAALAFSFVPILVVLARVGLLNSDLIALDEAIEVTRSLATRLGPDVPAESNPAKQLAAQLCGRIPVIYGSESYRGVVAVRWKGQINENAKAPASANVFPELDHNEVLSWGGGSGKTSDLYVVVLRDPRESKAIASRVDLTKTLIAKSAAGVTDVWSEGSSDIAKLCSLVYVADFVSIYLAYLYQTDPTPIEAIDWLKSALARA